MNILKRLALTLALFPAFCLGANQWALFLVSGESSDNANYRYYRNLQNFHRALLSQGMPRDHAWILYNSGNTSEKDTIADGVIYGTWSHPNRSLLGDSVRDIRYPANRTGLQQAFREMKEKIKTGDRLVIFMSGHGGKKGSTLWNDSILSPGEFKKNYLDLLPSGVTFQIISNQCYGGQFVTLTNENTCMISKASASVLNYEDNSGPGEHDPFVTEFSLSFEKGKNWLESYSLALKKDLPVNRTQNTSLDWIVNQTIPADRTVTQKEADSAALTLTGSRLALYSRYFSGSTRKENLRTIVFLKEAKDEQFKPFQDAIDCFEK